MAATLPSSGCTNPLQTVCPKYTHLPMANLHFLGLAVSPASVSLKRALGILDVPPSFHSTLPELPSPRPFAFSRTCVKDSCNC